MTNGSNSTSNHHPLPPRDDRETLSALFDGELPGDAMRFALKRLDHDAGWRDTCGRWQMIGDALRGEAMTAAPSGFAASVMRTLQAEARATAAAASTPAAPVGVVSGASRLRWLGGAALAASVAMVAVLAVRPFSGTTASAPESQVAAGVSAPADTAPVEARAPAPVPSSAPAVAAGPGSADPIAAARPAANRRGTDRASRRAAPVPQPVSPAQIGSGQAATAVAAAAPATTKPFHPPVDDVVTRPWPRAVLSEETAGALTVGLGSAPAASPSLYPFEPRLPDAQAIRPQSGEPQR